MFVICIITCGVLIYFTGLLDYLPSLPYYFHKIWPQTFHGNGRVIYLNEKCVIRNKEWCKRQIYSSILGEYRNAIVYLPENYEKYDYPLPLIIALHGNHSDENEFGQILPPILDEAIKHGNLPPLIMLSPDFSLGGKGLDSNDKYNKTGSFYINSNLGRYEDYFYKELIPWVRANFNISTNPNKVILLGQSMGGFGVFYLGFQHPDVSKILVGIYPAVDLRYSCNGNKMLDYDSTCYQSLAFDDPKRIRMSALGGLFKQTEQQTVYPIFKSNKNLESVWPKDMPVWKRMRSVNPTDMLRDKKYNLTNTSMFVIAGSEDEFNIDAQVQSFIQVIKSLGYSIAPDNPIRLGGHHTPDFAVYNLNEIIVWLNERLSK